MSPYPLPPRDLMLLSHYGAAIYTVNSNNNNNAVFGMHVVPPITTVAECYLPSQTFVLVSSRV